jgi:hypothetical protein
MRPRVPVTCKNCGQAIPGRVQARKNATCFDCKYKQKPKPKADVPEIVH